TATLLRDGRVFVAGGSDNGTHTLNSAEIYDPNSGTWTRAGHMTVPREAHVAVLLRSGKVLIAGGGRGDMPGGYISYQTAELYDPEFQQFNPVPARMKNDRLGAAAVLLNDGRALIVGGKTSAVLIAPNPGPSNLISFTPLNTAEMFDPESSNFISTANMAAPHYLPTATKLSDGGVLVVGGWRMLGPTIGGMTDAEL